MAETAGNAETTENTQTAEKTERPEEAEVQARVREIQDVFARKQAESRGLEAELDLAASARQAMEARARPAVVAEEAILAKLRASDPQSPDDSGPEIWCELYGFLDLGYKIHMNPYAVAMVTSAASALEKVLGDAVEAFPELEAMFIPLLAAVYAEGSAIEAVSQVNGSVVLIGVIPDPIPVPFPDN
ncbi:hypothetical protein NX801_03465 [Streptomyces sp. LP05-1]|uniref:Uncharacterized protein n=1 Tax=Streptomyces pyxinae TaxID=2970734 RepID=A0ABT2CBI4_9ACTN|nr:hypothetical protein [Streptomyces sp. LP05-1]MCS0634733.1 hypothetical protein [Streptomyces sp. LP05-1]